MQWRVSTVRSLRQIRHRQRSDHWSEQTYRRDESDTYQHQDVFHMIQALESTINSGTKTGDVGQVTKPHRHARAASRKLGPGML